MPGLKSHETAFNNTQEVHLLLAAARRHLQPRLPAVQQSCAPCLLWRPTDVRYRFLRRLRPTNADDKARKTFSAAGNGWGRSIANSDRSRLRAKQGLAIMASVRQHVHHPCLGFIRWHPDKALRIDVSEPHESRQYLSVQRGHRLFNLHSDQPGIVYGLDQGV